jgi:hypothetical protein
MDLETILKDAALFGLACGVIMMAAALIYLLGRELTPAIPATATIPKPPFGFNAP